MASGTRAMGVLPVTASQTSGSIPRQPANKPPTPRLKVVVRRLPPGLTEEEFAAVIGDEWKLGQGRVDWYLYKPGKDSKDPSKPSRPSRAYFHMTNETHLLALVETVRQATFEDAQNTFTSPCLITPPTVEFAPYGKKPGGKARVDARAGTIDQDPEFMAFLEGLANPTTTKDADSLDGVSAKPEKVTSTPLVQFLKDKKASKNKESAAKAAKKQELQQAKSKSAKEASSSSTDSKKKGKETAKTVVEKVAKEAVKILNREAATRTQPATASGERSGNRKLDLSKVPPRQKGAAVAAHIRMLQRDLGLSPAQAHRQVGRDAADARRAERAAEKATTTDSNTEASTSAQTPAIPIAPKANTIQTNNRRARGRGPELDTAKISSASGSTPTTASPRTPMILLKKPETPQTAPTTPISQPNKPPQAPSSRKPSVAVPSEGATQAFVKHANPSQGVTEALLKEAMEKFGAVSMVEIDKRKGFAYVDFVESSGLRKAMAANPISVAQGTVQVMQRKGTASPADKKPPQQAPHAPSHRGRGGGGGRGGTVGRRGGRGGGGRGGASSGGPNQGENSKPTTSTPTGPAAK